MVRVLSVHHFVKQNIQTVEQPTASCVALPDKLLLALSSHCIEVRDLNAEGEVVFTFPTVDFVKQIIHCRNGNYIATLESKSNRQNKSTNYVRIYANWDTVGTLQQSKMTSCGVSLTQSECGMVQPMRARIAGRVTPSVIQSEISSLEMIELPSKRCPEQITCCQVSGNILVLSSRIILTIYKFVVKTHDISKLKFIDFEELSINLELSFQATEIRLVENFIAAMNMENFHMFRIDFVVQKPAIQPKLEKIEPRYHYSDENICIDFANLMKNEENFNANVVVNLPSILRENSEIHKNLPFMDNSKDAYINIKSTSPIETTVQNYHVEHLMQLKLRPLVINGTTHDVAEEFRCINVKPLYVYQKSAEKLKTHEKNKLFLKSDYRQFLQSIAIFITTTQEGYLYQFSTKEDASKKEEMDNCIAVYPFTSPVNKIIMEDYILHALTETGLESYTLRIGHQLTQTVENLDNKNLACPSILEPVCLIGLRPFVGIEKMFLSEQNLVLLASSDGSPIHSTNSSNSSVSSNWTLYNLQLPTSLLLYKDILTVADIHKKESPQTYCHLLSEAHIVLRMAVHLLNWTIKNEHAVSLISHRVETSSEIFQEYTNSCAFLGDYYVMSKSHNEFKLALPYYKMAKLTAVDVIKRVKALQIKMDDDDMTGLLYYLKTILLEIKFSEADQIFTPINEQISEKSPSHIPSQSFADLILEMFNTHDPGQISYFVVKSSVMREYATDKIINIIMHKEKRNNCDYFALSLLYLQKGDSNNAKTVIEQISTNVLEESLTENWELLFDTILNRKRRCEKCFSDLTTILIMNRPEFLALLIYKLIIELRVISLNEILKIFMEYLPSRIGTISTNGTRVLQLMLERYLKAYFSRPENQNFSRHTYDSGTRESLKLLTRTYLSKLLSDYILKNSNSAESSSQISMEIDTLRNLQNEEMESKNSEADNIQCHQANINESIMKKLDCFHQLTEDDFLFSYMRYKYLDCMPPFDLGSKTCASYDLEILLTLKKLQALICSSVLPSTVINEIVLFLSTNKNLLGELSLQSLLYPLKEVTVILIQNHPLCVCQFAKERFASDNEWKDLIITIEHKIKDSDTDSEWKSLLEKVLKEVLTHMAVTLPLERLLKILPKHQNSRKCSRQETNGSGIINDKDNTQSSTDDQECLASDENHLPESLCEFNENSSHNFNDIQNNLVQNDKKSREDNPDNNKTADVLDKKPKKYVDLVENLSTSNKKPYIQDCVANSLNIKDISDYNTDFNDSDFIERDYERYIQLCKQTAHANQIKQFIITTGQQLLATLNL